MNTKFDSKKILLDHGSLKENDLLKIISIIEYNGNRVSTIISKNISDQELYCGKIKVYNRNKILLKNYCGSCYNSKIYDVYRYFLSNISTIDIMERKLDGSIFNNRVHLVELFKNIDSLFHVNQIESYVSHVVPHNIVGWAITFYCNYFNIPHYYFKSSILPGRCHVAKSGEPPVKIDRSDSKANNKKNIKEKISQYILIRKGNYSNYIPDYESNRRKKYRNQISSFYNDLKSLGKYGHKLPNVLLRRSLESEINGVSLKRIQKLDKFTIAMFLHYQPERTTLPEADWMSQQYAVASMLSDIVTERSGRLLLKEHPSQLMRPTNTKFRMKSYYEKLKSLPNTFIAPSYSNPDEIFNCSDLVVTCGGTVIFEALSNSIPVAYFNTIYYGNIHGLFQFKSYDDLKEIVLNIDSDQWKFEDEKLLDSLVELYQSTFHVFRKRRWSPRAFRMISKLIKQQSDF